MMTGSYSAQDGGNFKRNNTVDALYISFFEVAANDSH